MKQEKIKPDPTQPNPARLRPDPAFKAVTREFTKELGIETVETEFPQSVRADLILNVPEGLVLKETMFRFFRRFNIIEFKGQNNQLTEEGFVINEVRTNLLYLYNEEARFENMLNLLVSSRFPQRFFDYMEAHQCKFEQDKAQPWLWRCQVGLQEVVVIVCRDLPLEQPYYEWLLFAPSDSQKWRDFVKMLAREGNTRLLDMAREMRPKEYEFMLIELKELLEEYTPDERKDYLKAWFSAVTCELIDYAKEAPEEWSQTLAKFTAEQRLAGITPEQRLAGITPEERQQLLELLAKDDKKAK
ncbi:MAG: hypothetical protein WCS37_13325 [Chloroflexota bacterium]|nr:hypothetical protein [Chloroflexota bacterium]